MPRLKAPAIALALGLAVVACSDRDTDAVHGRSSAVAEAAASERAADMLTADLDVDAEAGGATSAGADGTGAATTGVPAVEEHVVHTADLRVRVADPAAAATTALARVEAAGGTLGVQEESEGSRTVQLTVRVPAARFTAVLHELAGLGTVLDRSVRAEEVTDQVVDLRARLENARASADRLRELLADAADVNQVVAVEGALTQREAEVEQLTGRLQLLEDRAARSTITATFVTTGEPVAEEEDDDASAFVRGLRRGGDVVRGTGAAVAAAGGFLVPVSPAVVVLALLALRWRRRCARTSAEDAQRPTPSAPSSPASDGA